MTADVQFDLSLFDEQPKKPKRKPFPRSPNAVENNRRYRSRLREREVIELAPERRCISCKETKPASEFHKNKAEPTGLATRCKVCKVAENRASFQRKSVDYRPVASKTCIICLAEKPKEEFYQRINCGDGLTSYCRSCNSAKNREKYKENSEDRIKASWVWQKQNPYKSRSCRIAAGNRKRVADAGGVGSFSAAEWRELVEYYNHMCAYCLEHEKVVGKLTCDHIIPISRGGTGFISNIAPACRSCNASKGNKTLLEFLSWQSENRWITQDYG